MRCDTYILKQMLNVSCSTSPRNARGASIDSLSSDRAFVVVWIFIESAMLTLRTSEIVRGSSFWEKNARCQIFAFYPCENAECIIVKSCPMYIADGPTDRQSAFDVIWPFTEIDMPDKWCSLIGMPITATATTTTTTGSDIAHLFLRFRLYCALSRIVRIRDSDRLHALEEQWPTCPGRKIFDDQVNEVTSPKRFSDDQYLLSAGEVKSKNILFVLIWCEKRDTLFAFLFAKKTSRFCSMFSSGSRSTTYSWFSILIKF